MHVQPVRNTFMLHWITLSHICTIQGFFRHFAFNMSSDIPVSLTGKEVMFRALRISFSISNASAIWRSDGTFCVELKTLSVVVITDPALELNFQKHSYTVFILGVCVL